MMICVWFLWLRWFDESPEDFRNQRRRLSYPMDLAPQIFNHKIFISDPACESPLTRSVTANCIAVALLHKWCRLVTYAFVGRSSYPAATMNRST